MEENKNNALEKAESIACENETNKEKEKVPLARERINEYNIYKSKEKKEKDKQERARIKAEKREKKANLIAHKRAERQKAKAMALREKIRKKEQGALEREQLKKERAEKREALKSETKKQRQIRKQAQREKRKNANTGYLVAIVSLGIATLVLASVLTFTLLMPSMNDKLLESNYQKSFYDVIEQVDNIDLNLSKALASADSGAMQKYLVDTAINSELAENDLQQLPLQDESKYYTTKLINQIGDYSKYLNNKIIASESLSKADIDGLNQLYRANVTLKKALQKMTNEMNFDYSFSSMIDGGAGDLIISNFNELQNLSIQFPELIYDGPFSDGQLEREIKGLKGQEISSNEAKEKFMNAFKDFSYSEVLSVGEAVGNIPCYNFQTEVKGDILYAQISKVNGQLITFSYAGSCKSVEIDSDDAIEKAMDFMANVGITNMKPVWVNLSNNVYTINFASVKDDVIIYSDLIKVRVCAETAMVIGFEATTYYTNHHERSLSISAISLSQAKNKVSKNIEIDTSRLVIVPIGKESEKLCYEFSGVYEGSTYYVYIDAVTGRQVEMFKVIDGTEGTLLM